MHVLDDEGKEHKIEIVKQIKKEALTKPNSHPPRAIPTHVEQASQLTTLKVSSTPPDADIELDGNFVGSTPSSLEGVPPGDLVGLTLAFNNMTRDMLVLDIPDEEGKISCTK